MEKNFILEESVKFLKISGWFFSIYLGLFKVFLLSLGEIVKYLVVFLYKY